MCCVFLTRLPLLQTLRDLVFDPDGQRLATSLIAALVSEQLDAAGGAAGVEELASALQQGAPAYFKDQDRCFYQVCIGLISVKRHTGSCTYIYPPTISTQIWHMYP